MSDPASPAIPAGAPAQAAASPGAPSAGAAPAAATAAAAADTPTTAAAPAAPTSLLSTPAAEAAAPKPDPAAQVPEKYDLQLPADVPVDQRLVDAYESAAREAGLTQAQVAKLTPALVRELQAIREAPAQAWAETNRQWVEQVKADPEIGGPRLPATLADAARAVEAFGGEALKQALAITGAGNNPAVVRAFAAIGRALGPDQTPPQPGRVAPPPRENSFGAISSRLYPTMAP